MIRRATFPLLLCLIVGWLSVGRTQQPHWAELKWSTTGAIIYNAYRGDTPAALSLRASVTDTVWRDNSVLGGRTYYYAVTGVYEGGVESARSSVVPATIPKDQSGGCN